MVGWRGQSIAIFTERASVGTASPRPRSTRQTLVGDQCVVAPETDPAIAASCTSALPRHRVKQAQAGRANAPQASKRLRFGPSLFSRFCDSARGSVPLFREFRIQPALIGVFFAVDRRNVRRIFIEIGSPDPIFLAVRVDPLPQDLV